MGNKNFLKDKLHNVEKNKISIFSQESVVVKIDNLQYKPLIRTFSNHSIPKKKKKYIPLDEILGNLLLDAVNISVDIHSVPSKKIKRKKKKIDALTLELLQKIEELNKEFNFITNKPNAKYEYPVNTEQKLYNAWKNFYKKHPICGRAVGFLFVTTITAIVTVFINNLLTEKEKCDCDSCKQIQYINEMTINYCY